MLIGENPDCAPIAFDGQLGFLVHCFFICNPGLLKVMVNKVSLFVCFSAMTNFASWGIGQCKFATMFC